MVRHMTTKCDFCGHPTVPDMVVVAWIGVADIIWLCQACAIIEGWDRDSGSEFLATFAQKAQQLQLGYSSR